MNVLCIYLIIDNLRLVCLKFKMNSMYNDNCQCSEDFMVFYNLMCNLTINFTEFTKNL